MATTLLHVQFVTVGFKGAPGYTSLYFQGAALQDRIDAINDARIFMSGVASLFPTIWGAWLQPELQILSDDTGTVMDIHVPTSEELAAIPGSGGVATFGATTSGLCIGWRTVTQNWTRKVRGRTFLVPLASNKYEANGTVSDAAATDARNAGNVLIASSLSEFGVWSRPRSGAGGKFAPATLPTVRDSAAVLRSRRD